MCAVYVLARALHQMKVDSISLQNATALGQTIRQLSFQGVSGRVSFDSRLDPVDSGNFDVVNFAPSGTWDHVGTLYSNGTYHEISMPQIAAADYIQATGCVQCKITIGGLFAVRGKDLEYHDMQSYHAAQVAIMRIQAGESLSRPDGTQIGPILQNVSISILLADTAHIRQLGKMNFLKESELNKTISEAVLSDRPFGFVGVGYSGEAKFTQKILSDEERVVVSHYSTSPALTDHPWYARTMTGPDNAEGMAMAILLKKMNFAKTTKIWFVKDLDPNYYEGLRIGFKTTARALGYAVPDTNVVDSMEFLALLSDVLGPPHCGPKSVVVVAAGFSAVTRIRRNVLKSKKLSWTNAVWIGPEDISLDQGAKIPGFIGIRERNVSNLPGYTALKEFWTNKIPEAKRPNGTEWMWQNKMPWQPIMEAHDAVWALLLAAHNVILTGGSVTNGSAIREALRSVEFAGASGNITFTNNLDRKDVLYDLVARNVIDDYDEKGCDPSVLDDTAFDACWPETQPRLRLVGRFSAQNPVLNVGEDSWEMIDQSFLNEIANRSLCQDLWREYLVLFAACSVTFLCSISYFVVTTIRCADKACDGVYALQFFIRFWLRWRCSYELCILLFIILSSSEGLILGAIVHYLLVFIGLGIESSGGEFAQDVRDATFYASSFASLLVLQWLVVFTFCKTLLPPQGWYMCRWVRTEEAQASLDTARNAKFASRDQDRTTKDSSFHSLQWLFFKYPEDDDASRCALSGVKCALPQALRLKYKFQALIYYRSLDRGGSSIEIAFQVKRACMLDCVCERERQCVCVCVCVCVCLSVCLPACVLV